MSEHPLHVLVVVQQPIFRAGVLAILKQMASCEVIGQPTTSSEALALAHEHEPEVALLDTLCASLDALKLARQLRACERIPLVVFSPGGCHFEYIRFHAEWCACGA